MNRPCYDFTAIDFELEEAPETIEMSENPMLEIKVPEPDPVLVSSKPPVIKTSENSESKLPEEQHVEAVAPIGITPSASPPSLKEMKPLAGDKVRLEEVYFYNNTYAFREDSESQLEEL